MLSQPLFFFSQRRHKPGLEGWTRLKRFSKRIDNWVHSDLLSGLYAQFLESYPEEVYPQMVEWNRSERPWERRLSIVSLFYYASQRRQKLSFELAVPLITSLIHDDHFYVQKGVGWALRELYNSYPEQGLDLIRSYASQIPPAGWYAATEKLSTEERASLKARRGAGRKRQ